ncbi:uncharacterized protein IWZ02DRAFT_518823 [Phyllosticta citriasiana]|uniref:Amidohydrolase-related domain-containing protein n=1 Tax=Phyllosticta citriasiana TaxID=595635 RepID=A0ABR1KU58_9PEZI
MAEQFMFVIHTSLLFDSKKKAFVSNISVTVDPITGLITAINARPSSALPNPLPFGDIDLTSKIVLPGLVDAHTHIFLHSYAEKPSLEQKRDVSAAERVIRATNHLRTALLAGYTTYRDLGSESMGEADASVRDAVARGLTPGPRLFVATRVLASTGAYEPRTENGHGSCGGSGGCSLPAGSDSVDGFYADYRRRVMRFPPKQLHPYEGSVLCPPEIPNPDVMVFAQEEMDMIVREARLARCPVAAHCGTVEAGLAAVAAGVTTVEHSYFADDELFRGMAAKGIVFVPTLAVCERLHGPRFPQILAQTKRAYDLGVRFAAGGDTGTFPHGENAREVELMIEAGIPVEDALESCTVGGWEACGGDWSGFRFGWFEPGVRADIIALDADPREDKQALRKVSFVMKDAKVWKKDGLAVGMA